jgi:hypothetical protein
VDEPVDNKMKTILIVIHVVGMRELSDTLHGTRLQRKGLGSPVRLHQLAVATGRKGRDGPHEPCSWHRDLIKPKASVR